MVENLLIPHLPPLFLTHEPFPAPLFSFPEQNKQQSFTGCNPKTKLFPAPFSFGPPPPPPLLLLLLSLRSLTRVNHAGR